MNVFALPLCFNKFKRVVVMVGQQLVNGLQYYASQVCLKNNNLIEKKRVKELKNCQNMMVSHVSFALQLCFNKRKQVAVVAGQKSVCRLRYHRLCAFALKTAI